jgi:ribose transport system substrate-binding protein
MRKLLLGTASLSMVIGLAGTAHAAGYKIGISNTVQGNGWREEMVCAMKAEARSIA